MILQIFSEMLEYSPPLDKTVYLLVLLFIVNRIINFMAALRAVNYLPGPRPPFAPISLPGALLPTSWWNLGLDYHWVHREQLYQQNETIAVVPWLFGEPQIYTSNLEVLKHVTSPTKSCFEKPEKYGPTLLLFGTNLAVANGPAWRRHRRAMGPVFNSKLHSHVWEESVRMYKDMINAENWIGNDGKLKEAIEVPSVKVITLKFALLLLSRCCFKLDTTWDTPPQTSEGEMTVQEAIHTVLDASMLLSFAPEWIKRLPFGMMKRSRKAYNQLTSFMKEQVELRRENFRGQVEQEEGIQDVFSMLVQANENESKYALDDTELIGNVFVMLFAGHETSAHTMAATLGFLAVDEEVQDEVSRQIRDVVGYDRDPVFDDYSKLNKVRAVFYEALRMFPAAHILPRAPTEDTLIEIPNHHGQEGTMMFPVLKNTLVVADMIGIQNNPRYFDEPEKFKPSRWYDTTIQPSAFGLGARGCIGKEFATVEAVCFLTMLLRDWKVEPLLNKGESKQEWRKRVLTGKIFMTLGVVDVPIRFVRRERSQA